MNVHREHFKKMFPNLAKEMREDESEESEGIDESKIEPEVKSATNRFKGYEPNVIDFLRRCDSEYQAEEIIAYLLKKKEISSEYAEKLRSQLRTRGVRSLGSKKNDADYLRDGGF